MSEVTGKDPAAPPATASQADKTAAVPAAKAPPASNKPGLPSKTAAAARGSAAPDENEQRQQATSERRRRIVWACVAGYLVTNFLMFLRFFLPRTLFEPKTQFSIGYPSDIGLGVETKFQKDYRIWVVRNAERIFAIYARCTHLGCTPDWKPSENKFKCPCHGSGYDSEGVNFEGPAPRPMDRARIEINAEGQVIVDTGILYDWPKGQRSRFNEPGSFLQV